MTTLREKQSIFTFNIHRFIEQAYKLGFKLAIGEGYGNPSDQRVYSSLMMEKCAQNSHVERLAMDFIIYYNDGKELFVESIHYDHDVIACAPLIDYWLSLNTSNEWGGNFKEDLFEPGHFEMRNQ